MQIEGFNYFSNLARIGQAFPREFHTRAYQTSSSSPSSVPSSTSSSSSSASSSDQMENHSHRRRLTWINSRRTKNSNFPAVSSFSCEKRWDWGCAGALRRCGSARTPLLSGYCRYVSDPLEQRRLPQQTWRGRVVNGVVMVL